MKTDRLMRVREAGDCLGVTRGMVYVYINKGKLAYVTLPSGGIRIRHSELMSFMQSLTTEPGVQTSQNIF